MKKTGYENVKEWRHSTKRKLIQGFGGKCAVCELVDHPCVYDMHHLDPEAKDFTFGAGIKSWKKLVDEASKCILLCAPCHRKHHIGILDLTGDYRRFDESLVDFKRETSPTSCPVCSGPKPIGQITCSKQCARAKRDRIDNWAGVDVIALYERLRTFSAVAAEIGVSDVSVKKRLIKLGHIKPDQANYRGKNGNGWPARTRTEVAP